MSAVTTTIATDIPSRLRIQSRGLLDVKKARRLRAAAHRRSCVPTTVLIGVSPLWVCRASSSNSETVACWRSSLESFAATYGVASVCEAVRGDAPTPGRPIDFVPQALTARFGLLHRMLDSDSSEVALDEPGQANIEAEAKA